MRENPLIDMEEKKLSKFCPGEERMDGWMGWMIRAGYEKFMGMGMVVLVSEIFFLVVKFTWNSKSEQGKMKRKIKKVKG